MDTVNLYTAIRAMILDVINTSIFPAGNIMQDFQTPTAANFISYVRLNSRKTGITGVNTYINDELHDIYTQTNTLLYENLIQIDVYSDGPYAASDAANVLYQYLTAIAPYFLDDYYPDMSIGVVEDIVNNTDPGDKATYLQRYTVRFTMFTHEQLVRTVPFIGDITITPVFVD